MTNKLNNLRRRRVRWWFTLIEILIVIVIIGILTVSLLPRITWAQAKARNVARKADLNQVATALAAYNGDNGQYPDTLTELTDQSYLKSLPKDPGNKKACSSEDWNYNGYVYKKQWDGYILWAYIEKESGNASVNYIWDCPLSATPNTICDGKCDSSTADSSNLRYVIYQEN